MLTTASSVRQREPFAPRISSYETIGKRTRVKPAGACAKTDVAVTSANRTAAILLFMIERYRE
jgi:hypothetical protein